MRQLTTLGPQDCFPQRPLAGQRSADSDIYRWLRIYNEPDGNPIITLPVNFKAMILRDPKEYGEGDPYPCSGDQPVGCSGILGFSSHWIQVATQRLIHTLWVLLELTPFYSWGNGALRRGGRCPPQVRQLTTRTSSSGDPQLLRHCTRGLGNKIWGSNNPVKTSCYHPTSQRRKPRLREGESPVLSLSDRVRAEPAPVPPACALLITKPRGLLGCSPQPHRAWMSTSQVRKLRLRVVLLILKVT